LKKGWLLNQLKRALHKLLFIIRSKNSIIRLFFPKLGATLVNKIMKKTLVSFRKNAQERIFGKKNSILPLQP
jgi:hypothetical protein